MGFHPDGNVLIVSQRKIPRIDYVFRKRKIKKRRPRGLRRPRALRRHPTRPSPRMLLPVAQGVASRAPSLLRTAVATTTKVTATKRMNRATATRK